MWELDHKESWVLKNWCFWTVMLEKTLESPLDCKEIKPVHPKGDQSWIFIGRTDAEAEMPILWYWTQEEKGMTEDEMVGCYDWLDGHEFEQALGIGDGQGSLVCYSQSMVLQRVRLDWVTKLNWNVAYGYCFLDSAVLNIPCDGLLR